MVELLFLTYKERIQGGAVNPGLKCVFFNI
jgi:hypothetical protein